MLALQLYSCNQFMVFMHVAGSMHSSLQLLSLMFKNFVIQAEEGHVLLVQSKQVVELLVLSQAGISSEAADWARPAAWGACLKVEYCTHSCFSYLYLKITVTI